MPRTPLADAQIASHAVKPATTRLQLDEFLDIGVFPGR